MRFCGSADGGLRGGLLLVYCFAADRFLVAIACFAVSAVVWVWQFPCVRPWGGHLGGLWFVWSRTPWGDFNFSGACY